MMRVMFWSRTRFVDVENRTQLPKAHCPIIISLVTAGNSPLRWFIIEHAEFLIWAAALHIWLHLHFTQQRGWRSRCLSLSAWTGFLPEIHKPHECFVFLLSHPRRVNKPFYTSTKTFLCSAIKHKSLKWPTETCRPTHRARPLRRALVAAIKPCKCWRGAETQLRLVWSLFRGQIAKFPRPFMSRVGFVTVRASKPFKGWLCDFKARRRK